MFRVTLQKLPSPGCQRVQENANPVWRRSFFTNRNLLLPALVFVAFGAFIDVLLAEFQHSLDQSGRFMDHSQPSGCL